MLSCNKRCMPVLGLLIQSKSFTVSRPRLKSYYDSLGVTPNATQTDIKTAYYNLSMKYHPDKNKGSEDASQKFRDITAAYEVLGNFKLRRLYDKGILHTAGQRYADTESEVNIEDDATTKFYKSRMHRSKPPTATGRTPIYDFDEWSRAHYGASFARREAAKQKFERKTSGLLDDTKHTQTELVVFTVSLFYLIYFMITYTSMEDYDVPLEKKSNGDNPNRLETESLGTLPAEKKIV